MYKDCSGYDFSAGIAIPDKLTWLLGVMETCLTLKLTQMNFNCSQMTKLLQTIIMDQEQELTWTYQKCFKL